MHKQRCLDALPVSVGDPATLLAVSWKLSTQACHCPDLRRGLQLEELAITGEEHAHANSWAIGLSTLPSAWSNLGNLRTLQLQGHSVLEVRPCTARRTAF